MDAEVGGGPVRKPVREHSILILPSQVTRSPSPASLSSIPILAQPTAPRQLSFLSPASAQDSYHFWSLLPSL